MHQDPSSDIRTRTPKQQLALNITAALRVAGPTHDGKPRKLRQSEVMRRTRMSRTTIQPLLDTTESNARTPDFRTLHKLSQAIGIPLAYLLMTPKDWRDLIKAINTFGVYQAAADEVVTDMMSNPNWAESVLKRCKVHPERPPIGATNDPLETKRLEARNEWRQRSSWITAALAQPAAYENRELLRDLTALAAALANVMTPYNPEPHNGSSTEEGAKA